MFSSKQLEGGKRDKRSWQFSINIKIHLRKDLFDSSNIKHPAIRKQINLLNNKISDFKDVPDDPTVDNDILNRS